MSTAMHLAAVRLRLTDRRRLSSPARLRRHLDARVARARDAARRRAADPVGGVPRGPVPHELRQTCHTRFRDLPGTTVHTLVPATDEPSDTPRDICVYLPGGHHIDPPDAARWGLVSRLTDAGFRVDVPVTDPPPLVTAATAVPVVRQVLAEARATAAATGHRVVLLGEGAGGGLALAALLADPAPGDPGVTTAPSRVALVSPWLDPILDDPAVAGLVGRDPVLHPAGLRVAAEAWRGDLPADDPRVAPLAAPSLRGLPPVEVWAGDREILLPGCRALAARLAAEGVPHRLHVTPGAVHAWLLASTPEGRRDASALVNDLLEG
ncbi:alpha/beta hydrolase fold domain-containing protein [Corynebacterium bovis]|uniref:alpha/beta hydrolase fold domain-containing protein n=1 Tax=Corynebacterium bovis TaxID=36808 RepID=UPI0031390E58